MADVPPDVRSAVGQLGSRLFTGQRAIKQADGFLTRIDHARLAKRLSDQRQMAAFVPTAERGAQAIQAQITAVADAVTTRRTLVDYAAEAPTLLHNPTIATGPQLDVLSDRIATATAALDDAITKAAAAVDPLTFKLSRTRSRGVYRSGNRYLVPYSDNLGADRVRDFATRSEAHDFRQATLIGHAHTMRLSSDRDRLPPQAPPTLGSRGRVAPARAVRRAPRAVVAGSRPPRFASSLDRRAAAQDSARALGMECVLRVSRKTASVVASTILFGAVVVLTVVCTSRDPNRRIRRSSRNVSIRVGNLDAQRKKAAVEIGFLKPACQSGRVGRTLCSGMALWFDTQVSSSVDDWIVTVTTDARTAQSFSPFSRT